MSAVFSLVVTSGPRLGDIESGSVAGATGARFSVVSGGLLCLIGTAGIVLAFPALRRYGLDEEPAQPVPAGSGAESRFAPAPEPVAPADPS
jgi:hypothetical protein